jgi:hypothetical protein
VEFFGIGTCPNVWFTCLDPQIISKFLAGQWYYFHLSFNSMPLFVTNCNEIKSNFIALKE